MKLPRIVLIPAIALIPVLPYALGYGGQDLNFHLASWLDLRAAWHAGHLLPVWAAGANFNLGDPHLGFYPPVPLLLGALLTSILPVALAPAAFIWIALCVAGFSMYLVAARFVAPRHRLPAAAIYILSPYLVATALVRFAAGELLVQAWLPLILLAVYNISRAPRRTNASLPTLAALLALTWLTNIPASIVLFYSLLLLAAFVSYRARTLRPFLLAMLAEAFALALAAFRLLPAWAERSFIQQASLVINPARGYLLFLPQARFPDGILMYVFWALFCGTFLLILLTLRNRTVPLARDSPALAAILLASIAVFFQTPLSYPLWTLLPQLAMVQFPFRFQLLEGAVLPLLLFAPATSRSLRRPVCVAVLALSGLPLLLFLSMHSASAVQPLVTRIAAWQSAGYPGAPEYLPAHALAASRPKNLAPVWTPNPHCHLVAQPSGHTIQTTSPDTCPVRFALFYYPYWEASDDAGQTFATTQAPGGLLELIAPPGTHSISLVFRARSRLRSVSAIVSLVTAALLLLWFLASKHARLRDTT